MQALKKTFQDFGPKYSTKNVIGSGAYGEVFEAKNNITGQKVAIKKIKNIFQNKFIALRALREVTLLRIINSPKIIKIHQIIPPVDPNNFDSLAIVLEYFPNDLSRIYSKNITLNDQNIQYIVYQIIVAFKYLKSAKILHRDLKPQNILLDKNYEVKLCDFGLARSIVAYQQPKKVDKAILQNLKQESEHIKKVEKLSIHVVTRWYRAPELILLQSQYDISIQMWSIACILAQLIGIHKKNKVSTFSYKPLFQGKACFPLSPPKNEVIQSYKNEGGFAHSQLDQLTKILEIIGTPQQQDLQNIKDKYALAYIKSFSKRARKSFKSLFNYSKPQWIDFLQKTLVFNPKKRLTIHEALEHPIFAQVRRKNIEIQTDEVFLNMNLHSGLTIEQIKQKFLQQIKYHQNKAMVEEK